MSVSEDSEAEKNAARRAEVQARFDSMPLRAETPRGHASLAAALAAFQSEVPSVKKGNTATVASQKGSYQYEYADLADVTEKALPLLGKHGLSFSAKPTLRFGFEGASEFVLEYTLRHAGTDESIEGVYPLPDPLATSPQSLGATITYARRYTLCAVTGVAPGGDDDDAHSSEAQRQPAASAARRQQRPPRQDPGRATPDEPIPAPKPSQDWSVPVLQAESVDQLKAVYEEADRLGELGLQFSGDGETVAQMILRRRGFLTAKETTGAEGPPKPGRAPRTPPEPPEPGVRDFVSEARAVESRADLRGLVSEAVAAGVGKATLEQMAQFEEGLPADPVPTGDGWYKPAEGPLAGDNDD